MMSNEINVEKAWENQLTRRIDELNKENQKLWGMLGGLAKITGEVLRADEKMQYGDWMDLIGKCYVMYDDAIKHLDKDGRSEQ